MGSATTSLDAATTALGLVPRALPPFPEIEREGLDAFIDAIAENRYSWTWKIEDQTSSHGPPTRSAGGRRSASVRSTAIPHDEYQTFWRAYDLPQA